jgi:hypothetical protein
MRRSVSVEPPWVELARVVPQAIRFGDRIWVTIGIIACARLTEGCSEPFQGNICTEEFERGSETMLAAGVCYIVCSRNC